MKNEKVVAHAYKGMVEANEEIATLRTLIASQSDDLFHSSLEHDRKDAEIVTLRAEVARLTLVAQGNFDANTNTLNWTRKRIRKLSDAIKWTALACVDGVYCWCPPDYGVDKHCAVCLRYRAALAPEPSP